MGALLDVAAPSTYVPHSWLANFAWNTRSLSGFPHYKIKKTDAVLLHIGIMTRVPEQAGESV